MTRSADGVAEAAAIASATRNRKAAAAAGRRRRVGIARRTSRHLAIMSNGGCDDIRSSTACPQATGSCSDALRDHIALCAEEA